MFIPSEDITTDGKWEWGGCSDDIAYGYRISKDFMDLKRRKRSEDIRTAVHRHNNEAGRQVSFQGSLTLHEYYKSLKRSDMFS